MLVPDSLRIKEKYRLAKCCSPSPGDPIVGYYSHDLFLKVHKPGCDELARVAADRLVPLEWKEIVDAPDVQPGEDYGRLEGLDFAIMTHHQKCGIDYSLKVARVLAVNKQQVFDRHRKLRQMGLLARVEPRIVQYRKGMTKNRWIKHRNHTYYELTEKGARYLEHHQRL